MMVPIVTVLAAQLVLPVADNIPKFDIAATCRAAQASAARAILGNDTESCANDERDARTTLGKEWAQFSAADRRTCTLLATTSTESSYVELLTCLEMTRDAKQTPATDDLAKPKR
jgi:hypothetical protein